jgi:hypothetical protein
MREERKRAAQRVAVQLPRAQHRIMLKKLASRARSGQLELPSRKRSLPTSEIVNLLTVSQKRRGPLLVDSNVFSVFLRWCLSRLYNVAGMALAPARRHCTDQSSLAAVQMATLRGVGKRVPQCGQKIIVIPPPPAASAITMAQWRAVGHHS